MKKAHVIGEKGGGFVRFVWGGILSVALLTILGLLYYGYAFYIEGRLGPEQPFPFSHRLHAGDKKISCLVCHETATTEANAGLPPLETCLLCHSRIATRFVPIVRLREAFFNRRPVAWQRIKYAGPNDYMPDFVYFNHAVHVQRSIDCGHCHGPVNRMDRINRVQNLNMGFCIECHKHYNASHDCSICHR